MPFFITNILINKQALASVFTLIGPKYIIGNLIHAVGCHITVILHKDHITEF